MDNPNKDSNPHSKNQATPIHIQVKHNPSPGSEPVSVARPDEIPRTYTCRIRTRCTSVVCCRFMLQERGFSKLNFRNGGRKPPGHNPLVLNQGVISGGLRPPFLKFSF